MVINLKNRASNIFTRTETLVKYYEDIRHYKLLSQEEEIELFTLLKEGDKKTQEKARISIVNSNQRFVVAVAKKFGTNENLLDLISEGNIGLMEAIDRFDCSKGVRFSTFAVWYIRRAINFYNINHGSLVTKTNIAKTYHVISQATNKFIQKELRHPTLDELKELLATEYNVNLKDNIDIIDTRFISIDDESDDDENQNASDIIMYRNNSSYSNTFENNINLSFNQEIVSQLLSKLNEREQKIIKLLFGIGYDREYELQEVAKKVGLTTERVRQLKFSIINKMKKEYNVALSKV